MPLPAIQITSSDPRNDVPSSPKVIQMMMSCDRRSDVLAALNSEDVQ